MVRNLKVFEKSLFKNNNCNYLMELHPRLDELVTALGREQVIELADFASEDNSWIQALLEACKYLKPRNRNRKAAWVIHHIFLRHPKLIESRFEQLIDVIDVSEDSSVHRELLKVILEVEIDKSEWVQFSPMLFDLGVGILFDEAHTKGMHYIAIRLCERFMGSEKERQEAVEAIRQMLTRYTGEKPICSTADRAIKRIEKKK
jgi:hypothetical protein